MFKEVESRKKYSEMEHEQLAFWREEKTFEKSVENRSADDAYVFYDGPPFITGVPHFGTLLSSIVKDVVPRYWTMKGKRVERVWGWDCHGLPAENFVEKKLGITDKRDVLKIGLQKYIETCHSAMVQGGNEWEETIERIGRWVDFKGAYKTMDKEYMESVWWAFKELHKKGKIYEGEKVLMYCTRCATPISKSEVAMDHSYRDVTDPSVYVKFPVSGEKETYFLAWTTTPWTLPANTALAVHPELYYAKVVLDGVTYIVVQDMVEKVFTDEKHNALAYEVVQKDLAGKDLVGMAYEPLFEDVGDNAHRVLAAEYVTTQDGTGIVHVAPAFGEEDYDLAKKEGVPLVNNVDDNGLYTAGPWKGDKVWDVNKEIAKTLLTEGKVLKINYITHSYPHCHRCATKIMYRAHPSWFMDIDGQRSEMLGKNENVNWFPQHFKEKRFRYTVETAPDWNLSRDRFWATAIPVWRCNAANCEKTQVVGSYAELKELSGVELDDYHRPYVDAVTFSCNCGGTMQRIDKVMDCWFESGSMPFAQFHYPFENKEKFEKNFPGNFISEYVGQVRAWFYYLHAVNVGLFGKEAFTNVVVTGTIAGSDGKKMSKSLGNYTDPTILIEINSADALRLLLMSSPLLNGEDYALVDKDVADVQRKLGTLWQSYSFFTMYANVDQWAPSEKRSKPDNILDRWIVSRLHELIAEVDEKMQAYDLPRAAKPMTEFIDDLSNWYIRRSRKRFWKSEDDGDKNAAYATLHHVLVELSKVMAPFTPFIAEEIYKNLIGDAGNESVHLVNFPMADEKLIDKKLNEQMAVVREVITEGLKLRAQASMKVRQPIATLTYRGSALEEEFENIIKEEMNVKAVTHDDSAEKKEESVVIDTDLTPELKLEGQARELIRHIQSMRKEADFNVDDHITLAQEGFDTIFAQHSDMIAAEVLANGVAQSLDGADFTKEITVDDLGGTVSITKQS